MGSRDQLATCPYCDKNFKSTDIKKFQIDDYDFKRWRINFYYLKNIENFKNIISNITSPKSINKQLFTLVILKWKSIAEKRKQFIEEQEAKNKSPNFSCLIC